MPDYSIKIKDVDSQGHLVLSDRGLNTRAWRTDNIIWQINTNKVKEITAITPKSGDCGEVFSDCPHRDVRRNRWIGKIKDQNLLRRDWFYNISWKDNADIIHTEDPKIAIKPPDLTFFLLQRAVIMLLTALGIFGIFHLFNKKKK